MEPLSRFDRSSIVLHADLRAGLPAIQEGSGPPRTVPAAAAKAVLWVLDSFPPDRCYPGEDFIARAACAPNRTVRRVLKALEAAGLVKVTRRPIKGRRGHSSNVYAVDYHRLRDLDPRAPHGAPAGAGGAQDRPTGPELQDRPTGPPAPAHAATAPAHEGSQLRPNGPRTNRQGQQIETEETDNRPGSFAAGRIGDTTAAARQRFLAGLELADWGAPYVPALERLGIHGKSITAVLREARDADSLQVALELLAKQPPGTVRNPAGFLRTALRDRWTSTPEGSTP